MSAVKERKKVENRSHNCDTLDTLVFIETPH
jgi:hypothetical protein